jgi:hypothetical protein
MSTHREKDMGSIKRIYVEHLLTDNYRTDHAIVHELNRLGYEASCGPLTMMPDGVDAIITYRQRSAWDFKSYLIELSVELKANFTGKVLASSRFYQPSVRTKTPEEAVHKVITSLIAARS